MKKMFLAVLMFCMFTACTNETSKEDTEENVSGPAPDNSNATNPSLQDTVYQADSLK